MLPVFDQGCSHHQQVRRGLMMTGTGRLEQLKLGKSDEHNDRCKTEKLGKDLIGSRHA